MNPYSLYALRNILDHFKISYKGNDSRQKLCRILYHKYQENRRFFTKKQLEKICRNTEDIISADNLTEIPKNNIIRINKGNDGKADCYNKSSLKDHCSRLEPNPCFNPLTRQKLNDEELGQLIDYNESYNNYF